MLQEKPIDVLSLLQKQSFWTDKETVQWENKDRTEHVSKQSPFSYQLWKHSDISFEHQTWHIDHEYYRMTRVGNGNHCYQEDQDHVFSLSTWLVLKRPDASWDSWRHMKRKVFDGQPSLISFNMSRDTATIAWHQEHELVFDKDGTLLEGDDSMVGNYPQVVREGFQFYGPEYKRRLEETVKMYKLNFKEHVFAIYGCEDLNKLCQVLQTKCKHHVYWEELQETKKWDGWTVKEFVSERFDQIREDYDTLVFVPISSKDMICLCTAPLFLIGETEIQEKKKKNDKEFECPKMYLAKDLSMDQLAEEIWKHICKANEDHNEGEEEEEEEDDDYEEFMSK